MVVGALGLLTLIPAAKAAQALEYANSCEYIECTKDERKWRRSLNTKETMSSRVQLIDGVPIPVVWVAFEAWIVLVVVAHV